MPSRILIVEDEQIIAEDLAAQVRSMGHEVIGISISGEEAVEVADETRPELVLMDIHLEGQMTGIESARIVQERTGATVIFVTAYPGTLLRDIPEFEKSGICVNKPYSRVQLEAALNKATAVRQSSPAS